MTPPYRGATRAHIREAVRLGRKAGAAAFHPQYLPGGGRDTARDPAGRAAALLAAEPERDWRIVGVDVHWEGPPLECAHCGNAMASAYGPVDDTEGGKP